MTEVEKKDNDQNRSNVTQLILAIFELYKTSADNQESNFSTVNLKVCNTIQEITRSSAEKYKAIFKYDSSDLEHLCQKEGIYKARYIS